MIEDIETVFREIDETKDDISKIEISDQFFDELARIRLDLNVSPFVPLTDDMIKWVLLAAKRATEKV